MSADPRSDLLFGKIALNWRLITRDLLNKALHYQRTREPQKPLGEILLEKGILSREQVSEILAYQQRINKIKSTQGVGMSVPNLGQAEMMQQLQQAQPQSMQGSWRGPGPSAHLEQTTQGMGIQPSFSPPGAATALGPTPPPDQDPLIGQHIGGTTINVKIGAGGMGAIYLAHHQALRKDVVVKILPPDSAANPRTVERFFREARAAAKLEHPNVVAVQDVGTTDRGLHYIIMQYIDGQNLEEKISSEGKQQPADALKIVLQVARGLKAAHEAGVIHRDIKAENILIPTSGVVKVTDFGLAKDLNSELKLTADGAMIGTPLYMAPEIGRVKEIDGRVDVYSLGVTFYYLLTGIQPFRGFSALEILSAKAHDKLKAPELYTPEISDVYRNVLGKMLEKDRDQRYTDIDTLIRDLEALDRDFPVDAGEPSIWPPRGEATSSSKLVKRNRGGNKRKQSGPTSAKSEDSADPRLILGLGVAVVLVILLIVVLIYLIMA